MYDFIVIGGGAAGFFAAINAKMADPSIKVLILERGKDVLQKVKISGGGRCNITHNCLDINQLATFYPRGVEFLKTAFEHFNVADTIRWFETQGMPIKVEADGRMFPASNTSASVIQVLSTCLTKLGIELRTGSRVNQLLKTDFGWRLTSFEGVFETKNLMLATGSDTAIWQMLRELSVDIVAPVPSLFTFNIPDPELNALAGLSMPNATVKTLDQTQTGPLLITHWGLSGPAILKTSAWAAISLAACSYQFKTKVNWLGLDTKTVFETLMHQIQLDPKKSVAANALFGVPARLWKYFCAKENINEYRKWAEMGKKSVTSLSERLTAAEYTVNGKSTFKEEFVTAGGIDLAQIDVNRFSFLNYPNLFAAGEVLNIDGVTGGFNFQAAWTGGYIVGNAVAAK